MLNLPSPQTAVPLDLLALVPAEPQPVPEMLPSAGLPLAKFAGLLAAQVTPLPAAANGAVLAEPRPEADPASPDQPASEQAIDQAWALALVPELANLPAQIAQPITLPIVAPPPPVAPAAGGSAGDPPSPVGGNVSPWPLRAALGPRLQLAAVAAAAASGRAPDWRVGLPAAPFAAPLMHSAPVGQPIALPLADGPPRVDPALTPFLPDPANPQPLRLDQSSPAPLALPTVALPLLTAPKGDQPAAPAIVPPALPASGPAAPTAVADLPSLLPRVVETPVAAKRKPVAGGAEPLAASALPDQPIATNILPSPAAQSPAAQTPAAQTAATQTTSTLAEPTPALAIASDRLGDVAVRLSGTPDQLQVAMQAQPAAAALIGADAARLQQDLAAAGVALAGLSVNGQRADLGANLAGGQRERQRQNTRRDEAAPIAGARRLAARSPAARQTITIDRFA